MQTWYMGCKDQLKKQYADNVFHNLVCKIAYLSFSRIKNLFYNTQITS